MTGRETKYTLDANLFIAAFRDPARERELKLFHQAFAPFEHLSAVVAQELRAGARTPADLRALERHVLAPFVRRGRLLTPSFAAWQKAGDVLARLVWEGGFDLGSASKAFANDILLALSCREAGVTLVTDNLRDFERIARVARFRFVAPWPRPRG